jgi:signal transduction histidine kinase
MSRAVIDEPPAVAPKDPKDLEQVVVELEAALQARDGFLRLATHELRSPLAAIQLQADTVVLLLKRGASASDIEGRAVRIGRLVQRLARLLEEVLDLARASSGRLELAPADTDLAGLVRREVERIREDLARTGSQVSVIGPARLVCLADQQRIEHVIGRLLSEVVRAAPGQPIEIALSRSDRVARIELRGGIGVSVELRKLAFASFADAVAQNPPGTSVLPLWLSRTVVDAHGGELELGDGFAAVSLPLDPAAAGEKLAPTGGR